MKQSLVTFQYKVNQFNVKNLHTETNKLIKEFTMSEEREEDTVASIVDVHPSANWFEREIYDMFGL